MARPRCDDHTAPRRLDDQRGPARWIARAAKRASSALPRGQRRWRSMEGGGGRSWNGFEHVGDGLGLSDAGNNRHGNVKLRSGPSRE